MKTIISVQVVTEDDPDIFSDTVNAYLEDGYTFSSPADIKICVTTTGWWFWSETYVTYSVCLVEYEE